MESIKRCASSSVCEAFIPRSHIRRMTGSSVRKVWANERPGKAAASNGTVNERVRSQRRIAGRGHWFMGIAVEQREGANESSRATYPEAPGFGKACHNATPWLRSRDLQAVGKDVRYPFLPVRCIGSHLGANHQRDGSHRRPRWPQTAPDPTLRAPRTVEPERSTMRMILDVDFPLEPFNSAGGSRRRPRRRDRRPTLRTRGSRFPPKRMPRHMSGGRRIASSCRAARPTRSPRA